jgi:hypothetical protein
MSLLVPSWLTNGKFHRLCLERGCVWQGRYAGWHAAAGQFPDVACGTDAGAPSHGDLAGLVGKATSRNRRSRRAIAWQCAYALTGRRFRTLFYAVSWLSGRLLLISFLVAKSML